MNFDFERQKPLFVVRGEQIKYASAFRNRMITALNNHSAFMTRDGQNYIVEAIAAKFLPQEILLNIDQAQPHEAKELIIQRLKASTSEKFEFLDGRIYSGDEAAREVEKGSDIGKYFLDIEKETIKIVQAAAREGQL